jgi:hypothetical protein
MVGHGVREVFLTPIEPRCRFSQMAVKDGMIWYTASGKQAYGTAFYMTASAYWSG